MSGFSHTHSRKVSQQAFSLVELIVTMAVAFIVIAALMQSMVSSLDSWTKQEKQFSSQREGRAALRILADDLASIAIVPSGGPMAQDPQAQGDLQPMRFLLQLGSPTATSTSRMAFLRTVKRSKGSDSGRGDLQLVLYGLALTSDGGASGLEPDASSKKLVRREFSPAETFRRLESHRISGQPLVFAQDWVELESPTPPPIQPGIVPEVRNAVLAHDVIRFDCKTLENLMPNQPPLQTWPEEKLPNWVEVTLRVTNRQTGRLLKSEDDWRGEGIRAVDITNNTPEVYEDDKEVRTFSMRLRLPSIAL